jgi:hypothetical protein
VTAAIHCIPVVCHVAGSVAGSVAKGVATRAASSVMTVFSHSVLIGASWVVAHVVALLNSTTKVDLRAPWFEDREESMLGIAALLVCPLLGAATIGAIIRQDGRRLLRVFGVGLPVAVVGAVAAVALAQYALAVVDEMCRLITPAEAYKPLLSLGVPLVRPGVPSFVELLVASFLVLGALALWMEMVVRAAVLYIAVFFLPLGLAAYIWPSTAHVTKRFVEFLIAVIGSKFVIVATLTLGVATIGHGAGIDAAVAGTAIVLLAAFAPFTVLRLVPLVEAAAISHLEGAARGPGRAAISAASTAQLMGPGAAGILGGLGRREEGGLTSGGVGTTGIAERVGDWPGGGGAGGSGGGAGGSGGGGGGSGGGGGGSGGGGAPSVAGVASAGAAVAVGVPTRAPAAAGSSGDAPGPSSPQVHAPPTVVPGSPTSDPEGWSGDT